MTKPGRDLLWADSIDGEQLRRIGDEIGATLNQVRYALHSALRRTEATLRKNATSELKRRLNLRAAVAIRKRFRSLKVKSSIQMRSSGANKGEAGIWLGLNDLPVSDFKGRPADDPAGAFLNDYFFENGFVTKSKFKGKNTIFKRAGKSRLPIQEQTIDIWNPSMEYIEADLFQSIEELFWQHFRRDLKARVQYKIGGL